MLLPRQERQPLCEACCDDAPPPPTFNTDRPLLLPHGSRLPKIFGVAATLSPRAKLTFIATNVPYFAVAAYIYVSSPVLWSPHGPLCCTVLCASAIFHGSIVTTVGAVSTYWHGAQCQLQPSCCRWLYCYSETQGWRLHSAAWLRRLVVTDVSCSVGTMLVGCGCFGPRRTLGWLAPALVFFFAGTLAKMRGRYALYALAHGLWHLASAASIFAIVLIGDAPPWAAFLEIAGGSEEVETTNGAGALIGAGSPRKE